MNVCQNKIDWGNAKALPEYTLPTTDDKITILPEVRNLSSHTAKYASVSCVCIFRQVPWGAD